MTVFKDFAAFYDAFNADKDYNKEADYIARIIKQHCPECSHILDLGCGTGIHAALLAEKGYIVHGVDRSPNMLQKADARKQNIPVPARNNLEYFRGDITNLSLAQTYDVVLALFHVISYQTTNAQLNSAIATAAHHLKPGGIFIFDYWFGPAVLSEKPEKREKHFETNQYSCLRKASPELLPNSNCVDVNYLLEIRERQTGKQQRLRETHRMRYLFLPEVDYMLSINKLSLSLSLQWMTDKQPGLDTWSVYSVARKND